ncbi:hypothetical protein Poly30_30260 [Planctomycetes bacterium Poly30]|uniref:ABC-2 family transporter protein n=1 Tax=Saltatorellus ferox TaxID=2528018 RepID=A0A518ETT7_9BACT|nr:hypothetical protein Poly30_30260 [Planctomycetes bacterium Poly30]
MSWFATDAAMVRRLVLKDWQVYQKQLAGYVAGMLLALGLIGLGHSWAAGAGALLLLVLLVVVGSYSIQTLLLTERKQQNVPFIMSLPVTPMDVYWGKLLANLAIYLVPFTVVAGGMIAMVLSTPMPDGLVVWTVLIAAFLLTSFCVLLCVAISCSSEGWNIFTMIALMTLVGPFILWVTRSRQVGLDLEGESLVFGPVAIGLLAADVLVVVIAIGVTSWLHARKSSFL